MGFVERAHDIIEAKANRVLDQVEDPKEMLDLAYLRMLEQLTAVRRALAEIAASRRGTQLQEAQLGQTVQHLAEQARSALAKGREDLAKRALSRKGAADAELRSMKARHQQLSEQEDKLTRTLRSLQERVNAFRTEKEVLKAQYTVSRARATIGETHAGMPTSTGDVGESLQRALDKMATVKARSIATDELLESGLLDGVAFLTDDIEWELAQLEATSQVDEELAKMKQDVAAARAVGGEVRETREPSSDRADDLTAGAAATSRATRPSRGTRRRSGKVVSAWPA